MQNDGQSELAEELACHAGHEGDGQVHHHIADRNGNRRHTDFHTALHRRLFWTFPSGQMAVDIFQHHNGVVYQDADTKGHTHERHHVECKASQVHGKKEAIREVGMAIMTAAAERQPRRKRKSTRPVVKRPSTRVPRVLWRAVRT